MKKKLLAMVHDKSPHPNLGFITTKTILTCKASAPSSKCLFVKGCARLLKPPSKRPKSPLFFLINFFSVGYSNQRNH